MLAVSFLAIRIPIANLFHDEFFNLFVGNLLPCIGVNNIRIGRPACLFDGSDLPLDLQSFFD